MEGWFTRDVTPEGLRSLLQRETQVTLRLLTREVDLTVMRPANTVGGDYFANPADEEYRDVRLEAYIRNRSRDPGRQLIDGVVDDVLRFCGTARPHDDMTLMCVGRGA